MGSTNSQARHRRWLPIWVVVGLLASLPYGSAVAACRFGATPEVGSPAVTSLHSYRAGFNTPTRLALTPDGRLLITDPKRGVVVERGADGRLLNVHAVGAAVSIAVAGDGGFYLGRTLPGRVDRYDASWQLQGALGIGDTEFATPNDIGVDTTSGRVYVVDTWANRIQVYAADGTPQFQFGSEGLADGQFRFPTSLHVDRAQAEVLVSDQFNSRIQVFALDGTFKYCLGRRPNIFTGTRSFDHAQGVVTDSAGRVYVADSLVGGVKMMERNGADLGQIGDYGVVTGKLQVPVDVAIDAHNRLFVAAAGGARLEVYGLDEFTDPERFAPATVSATQTDFERATAAGEFVVHLEVPGYRLADVDVASVTANGVPALSSVVGNVDGDLEPDLALHFDLVALLGTLPDGPSRVSLTGPVSGLIFDGAVDVVVTGSEEPAKPRGRREFGLQHCRDRNPTGRCPEN